MDANELEWATFWVTLVGTVATVAALVSAIIIGLHEVRAIRRENADRDRDRQLEQELRTRSQADCISAVLNVEARPVDIYDAMIGRTEATAHHAYVDVFNSSALPIYDVEVRVRNDLRPDGFYVHRAAIVAGGKTAHLHTAAQPNSDRDGEPVQITFKDAAGLHWHRLEDGDVHLEDPDNPTAIPDSHLRT